MVTGSMQTKVAARKGQKGFTLIELIVVMTLITIMLGFATPQLRSVLFVDGTKKTSRWMMITIPTIRTKAIREQELMVLGISIDQNNMWVVDPQPTKTEKSNDEDGVELVLRQLLQTKQLENGTL